MPSYANLVHPQIMGVWWLCDRPIPGTFPAPPPKAREKRPGDEVERTLHLKENSHCFKLYRAYYVSYNSQNIGQFFCGWILNDYIEVQEKKKKVVVLSSSAPQT